jgi:hypothetical protein
MERWSTGLQAVSGHLPPAFRKLASRLGGSKADTSHIAVTVQAIALNWSDVLLSATIQQAMFGARA